VIRNVVMHITNEQPLLADLYEMPISSDVSLVCTNVRMLDGKKPIFVDHSASVFVFPYLNLRFLEIVPGSVTEVPDTAVDEPRGVMPVEQAEPIEIEAELELDEDFLRRIREV
jgi:hypothetical protein